MQNNTKLKIFSLLVIIGAFITVNSMGCTPSRVHTISVVAPEQEYKLLAN